MLCDLCKVNNAVIHIEKHSGENHTQLRVCCECAGIEGLSPENLSGEALQKLITGVTRMQEAKHERICSHCGTDTETFKNTCKAGCSQCYNDLGSSIDLREWQRSTHLKHIGKTPYGFKVEPQGINRNTENIDDLEEKLVICISEEDYEKAAELRDRINEIKKS